MEAGESLLGLIGARGPSKSPNEGSRNQVCSLLWKRREGEDNSISFLISHISAVKITLGVVETQDNILH